MSDPKPWSTVIEKLALLHPLFASVDRPPKSVWIEGSETARKLLDRLPTDGLAVVGTRSPDPRAVYHLQSVMRKLRGTNLIILSGLARGIDTHAHEAALAAGLPTIGILGCGINRMYPPENLRLRKRILEAGGLVISEFHPDLQAHAGCFIQRNRLIAGFARATWIVQSGYRSGALNTARWARDHHRKVFATPSFPGDPAFLGNQTLLNEHAGTPVWGAENFVSEWTGLFSQIEINRQTTKDAGVLDLLLEVEKGMREGKDLSEILESRQRRTGESIESLVQKLETRALLS